MFDATPALRSAAQAAPAHPPAAALARSRVDLVIAGARGQVGTALRAQLARRQAWLREHEGLDLRVVAAFDRRLLALDLDGLGDVLEDAGLAREAGDGERLLDALCKPRRGPCVLVDCTASEEIADWYPRLLGAGVGVVAANKRANARDFAHYRQLQALARFGAAPYRYETTVGAAIPVLGPLRDLRLRGERIESLRGVLSGSLSHVLHRLHEGLAFSAAVAEARALGLTEPDPFEDLAARDLSRKLLVLAREAGFALEATALRIEPLCDAPQDGESPEAALAAADADWHARVAGAKSRGERLVVLAEADAAGGRIGVRSLPQDSPFARLAPGENRIEVRTEWQSRAPLALGGPGAGAEITAAGLVSDILQAARELAPRRPSVRQ
jgi:homoserine dehydrogenase